MKGVLQMLEEAVGITEHDVLSEATASEYAEKAEEYKNKAKDYDRRRDNVNEQACYFHHFYYLALAAYKNKDLDTFTKYYDKVCNVYKRNPVLKRTPSFAKKIKELDNKF